MGSRNGPRNPCLSILACGFFLLLLLLQPAAGTEPLGARPGKIGLLVKRQRLDCTPSSRHHQHHTTTAQFFLPPKPEKGRKQHDRLHNTINIAIRDLFQPIELN